MKILVTGASGFAGSHLVEALTKAGHTDVYGTAFGGNEFLQTLIPADHIVAIDLTKQPETEKLISELKPDWIFHLAALAFVGKSFEKGVEVLSNNMTVQLNMLEAVRTHVPQAKLLTIGSAEEYGISEQGEIPIKETHPLRPINPYAVSKVAQDLLAYSYAVSYKLNVVRVRPFNHIGERQTDDFAVSAFAKQIVEIERGTRKTLSVGNLKTVRDFHDVKDTVKAYMLLLEKGVSNDVYNVGSGVGVSMETIVQKLITISGAKVVVEQDSTRLRPHDIPEVVADASKIRGLGWNTTIPLDDSLKRVLDYWRAQ